MRVIAGLAKGRKLSSLKGSKTRPTLDSVRESLFSILGPHLEKAVLLDLFAGTGALGIEGLSRGARHCTFIDSSPQALAIIRQNLSTTGFTQQTQLMKLNLPAKLNEIAALGKQYDIIFADPPYEFDKYEKLLETINEQNLLKNQGQLIIEHAYRRPKIDSTTSLTLTRSEKYGETAISFFT